MDSYMGLGLIVIVVLLGIGAGLIIVARRQMRWGEAATPQEVARIERAVRRRGGEGASDIIEILALDGRIQNIWLRLGLGAGALLAAACVGIYLVVSGDPGPGDSTFLAVLAGSTIALFPGIAIGIFVGFSRMKREPRNLDTKLASPRLWDYCPPIVLIFPFLVLFGNLLLMSLLVLRLAPNLDSDSLARAFALPGMWSVPVAPAVLLVLAIAMIVVIWRFGALPLLVLPRDADARRRADSVMRKVAILQIVIAFSAVAVEVGLGQFTVLATGFYPSIPLYMAGLEGWYLIYIGVLAIIMLIIMIRLIRFRRIARHDAAVQPQQQP